MAINRISGNILADDLRRGANLAVQGNLLYIDVVNNRVGVNNSSPVQTLSVTGNARLDGVVVSGNAVSADSGLLELGSNANVQITGGSTGYVLTTDGTGNLTWAAGNSISGVLGNSIQLGTPADGNLVENVAYEGFTTSSFVTDSIDDLNQVILNTANNTYVGRVDFSGTPVAGASPMSVDFVGTFVGNPNSYLWDFGDGNTSVAGSNVSHTYSNVAGGQFTVSFTAYNTNGTYSGNAAAEAKGSVDSETKSNYITLYTPNPIPSFALTSDQIDSSSNAEITNNSQYATSYQLDWGAGAGNVSLGTWTTQENTYVNSSGDTIYTIVLYAISNTAGPSPVTVSSTDDIRVYSLQNTTFTSNTVTVINEEATAGGVVEFENTTSTNPGNTSAFGSQQKYLWTWGDGNVSNVNIQSGLTGNPGANITHAFALSGANQAAGNSQTFDVQLSTLTGHSSSPFNSANVTITVEPDVRAIFTGTANVISDRVGDDAQDGYLFQDYRNGANRAEFTFINNSQNGDIFDWSWGDGNSSGNVSAGNTGTPGAANITYTYASTGSRTVDLDVWGTPGTIAQSDTESKSNYITIRTNPAAPGNISSKTLSLSTVSQGTSPRLAAGATDNTGGNIAANGTSVIRYTTSTPIQSSTVSDANTATAGTLTAYINGSAAGNVTFDAVSNNSGTYANLVVSDDRDAHLAISSSVYPTGFYKVFDASITANLVSLPIGFNDYQLSHSTAGNTNVPGFVKDNLTAAPTIAQANAIVVENTAGTYRYISGVPYYNTGSPTVDVVGLEVQNFTGQCYRNTSTPLTVTTGTLSESTTGTIVSAQTRTYAQIDGSPTMLTSGIPNANVGVVSNYVLGNITVSVNGSARAVGYIDTQMINMNGVSSIVDITNKQIQIYSLVVSGIDESNIPVSASLGTVYTDNGVRVTGLGSATDTPVFANTNYYTGNAWAGAETVAGTQEAIVRWGTARHFTTDLSTGYLPAGPDLNSGRSGTQYFTFAFRRATVANFDITVTSSTGISGMWIAAPGTQIDSTSGLNGWLDCSTQYAGSGIPGSNTGAGGNGGDGCALTGADVVPTGTAISNVSYTMTLGSENMSNATGNNVLVRIALASGETLGAVSIGVAS